MSSPPKMAFTTLGCRLNQAESDLMSEELAAGGFTAAGPGDEPDIVVINTCTVTREATKASRSAIRRAVRAHPSARVVVAGCFAVSDPHEVEAIAGVDALLSNEDKERFLDALRENVSTAPLLQIAPLRERRAPAATNARVRANLKVQTGCDEWCSFCIIPTTRGPLRSLDEEGLVSQARAKVAAGAREIVLTGVHLGKYSYDRGGDESALVSLLTRLLGIDELFRIRLSSILSRHLTEDLVELIASEPRICRYLHVPLQSGDDGVLRAMNRPYRMDDYVASLRKVRDAIPGLALATDIIVGFPGETDGAFEATMDVVRELEFCKLHVFRFSARPGTAAAVMDDEVHPDVKKDRSKRLIDLGNARRLLWLEDHLGRPLEVLVEDERIVEGVHVSSGQTDDYVRVWFEGGGSLGSLVEVVGDKTRADGVQAKRIGGHDG